MVEIEGTEVQIGKRSFVVPEATLETAEELFQRNADLVAAKTDAEVFRAVAEVVALMLRGNYPDLDAKEVKKLMPFRGCLEKMNEVIHAAGMGVGKGEAVRP